MKRFAPSKCLLVTSGWILALCLTPTALYAALLEVTKVTTLEPVVRSESTPQSSVPGVLKATVTVAPILHSTRQTPSTVQLRANCEGDGDGVPISISGSSLALTLPTAPNAQPSYTVTLKWDGTYQGTVMPVQGYACTLEAVLSRGTSATLPELVSPPFEVAESWMLKSYSDAEGVSVTSSSNGNVTVNATATLTSDPDGSTSTSPVQLTVSKSAVLDSPEVPTQDNKLVVALELLTPGNVPVGTELLIGLGQVVRMLPADTQVVSGSVELRLPYDSTHFDPITLSPARFDSALGEWLTCDMDPACGGFSIDTTAKVLKVQTKEFSDWTTVDQNTVSWRVSFTSTSGATEVQIATGRSNTINGLLTVSELESEYDEDLTPITHELEPSYVRWLASSPTYPANSSASTGTLGLNGSCADYPSNCPYVLNGVNQAVGTYYLQAVLDLGYTAYQLGDSTWSNTQCPQPQPGGDALLKIYQCLKVRSVQLITWYRDSDGDNYGNKDVSLEQETQPTGYVSDNTDCDDTSSDVHPGASELIGNERDDDCIDGEICYVDVDGDGYRSNTNFIASSDADCQDGAEASVTEPGENCDDNNNSNPSRTEVCDTSNVDEDCDGAADDADTDGASGKTVWYYDADNDTYGTSSSQVRCDASGNYRAVRSGDCNDTNSTITFYTYYRDSDGDSYGAASIQSCSSTPTSGYVTRGSDCDDTDDRAYPEEATYYTTPRNSGGYDYDCNGTPSKYWSSMVYYDDYADCLYNGHVCMEFGKSTDGWKYSVPDCGEMGSYEYVGGCETVYENGQPECYFVASSVVDRTQKCK